MVRRIWFIAFLGVGFMGSGLAHDPVESDKFRPPGQLRFQTLDLYCTNVGKGC